MKKLPHPNAEMAAILLATGQYPVEKVAELANVPPKTIYHWQEDADFQAVFLRHQEKYHRLMVDEAIEELRADHGTNVKFLKQVRDGQIEGVDSKMLKVRLEAARTIADEIKTHAKRVEKAPPQHYHFDLRPEDKQRIDQVMAEDAIDVESIEEVPDPDDAA